MINRRPVQTRKREQWVEVPLPEGTYADATRPFSQQDVVNYLKESAEAQGTRSSFKLLGVPGLKPWASIGDGPFRGARNVESKRFAVLGNYLYQFSKDGTSADQLGYVPGRALVQMSHNQIAGGHEVAIATGSAGYIYNTVTGDFGKITDPSFSGGKSVTFIDQMFVWVDAQGRHFQPSNIAAGTEYNALEEQEAEMAPDKIQCAVAALQKLWVFGKETLQAYTSTGDPEELFADDKAGINVGCASPHAVAQIDNTLIWVDNKGILRRLNGGIAQRISTHPIEKAWAECDLSKCFVYTWEDVGHAVVYITFPDGMTWGYDCATQRIHRRQSKGMNRCRLNGLVQWDGVWYGGDFNSGTLYSLDWEYPLEGCDELKGRVVMPGLHNSGNRVQVDGIRVQFDTGKASVECEDVEPIVPATYITVAMMQGGWGAQLARFNTADNTTEILGTVTADNVYYQSRPFMLGDDLALVRASNNDEPAVRIHRPATDMELIDNTLNDSGRICVGAEKVSEARFVQIMQLDSDASFECELWNYDGEVLTLVDMAVAAETYGAPDYLQSCVCLGKPIFLMSGSGDNRFLICTVSGDTITTSFSTVGPSNGFGSGLCAIGNLISTGKGQMFTFSGTDMTSVQATVDSSDFVTTDGNGDHFFYGDLGSQTAYRLAASPYTKTAIGTDWDSTPGGGGGYIFIPGDDQSFGANINGVYQWSGSAYASIAAFQFDDVNEGDINNMVATVVATP